MGATIMGLKICSFNIRYDNPNDGINSFENRKDLILREFPKYEADVVGFQEVLPHMRDWLEESMPDYTVVGTGRAADRGGEHTCIAYRTDRFLLVSLYTFWLSDTPSIPGSRFGTDQSRNPRICTAAVLMERESGKLLRVYNTHLDHLGELAKAQGITQVLAHIAQDDLLYPDVRVVLTGDFNAKPDSPVVTSVCAFQSCGVNLRDVTAHAGDTFHAYRPWEISRKIDYIFTTAVSDSGKSKLLTDSEDGVYLSDHYPIMAEIEI